MLGQIRLLYFISITLSYNSFHVSNPSLLLSAMAVVVVGWNYLKHKLCFKHSPTVAENQYKSNRFGQEHKLQVSEKKVLRKT
jgi:hypothetical protein